VIVFSSSGRGSRPKEYFINEKRIAPHIPVIACASFVAISALECRFFYAIADSSAPFHGKMYVVISQKCTKKCAFDVMAITKSAKLQSRHTVCVNSPLCVCELSPCISQLRYVGIIQRIVGVGGGGVMNKIARSNRKNEVLSV